MPANETVKVDGQFTKTCLVRVVTTGAVDQLIKVYPADSETETIFLDNRNGIDRLAEVEKFLNDWVPKGMRVPQRVPANGGGKSNEPQISDEQIPTIRLDGAYFKAKQPPKIEHPMQLIRPDSAQYAQRMNALERGMADLADAVAQIGQTLARPTMPAPLEKGISCGICGKSFASRAAVGMHKGRFHKKEKSLTE